MNIFVPVCKVLALNRFNQFLYLHSNLARESRSNIHKIDCEI